MLAFAHHLNMDDGDFGWASMVSDNLSDFPLLLGVQASMLNLSGNL